MMHARTSRLLHKSCYRKHFYWHNHLETIQFGNFFQILILITERTFQNLQFVGFFLLLFLLQTYLNSQSIVLQGTTYLYIDFGAVVAVNSYGILTTGAVNNCLMFKRKEKNIVHTLHGCWKESCSFHHIICRWTSREAETVAGCNNSHLKVSVSTNLWWTARLQRMLWERILQLKGLQSARSACCHEIMSVFSNDDV